MDANEKIYDQLHTKLAAQLLAWMQADECEHCGRAGAGAKDLTVARAFLVDNGITAVARPKTPLHRLADSMPFEDPEDQVTRKQA